MARLTAGNHQLAASAVGAGVATILLLVAGSALLVPCAGAACPDGCTTYGTCYEPLGRCDCPWNRTGPACQQLHKGYCLRVPEVNTCSDDHPSLCVNACNQRGRCMGGFCHCQPGYYGTDCSLSNSASNGQELLAGLGYTPSSLGPKIFVYELPPEFHVKRNIHKIDRPPLHLAILERLLTSGHRTANGDDADFFYLPISSRDLKRAFLLLPAFHYIMEKWPYWNATAGARHVIAMEGDVGTCELPLRVRLLTANVTWLQFWGLYDYHPSWSHIFHNRIPCHVTGRDIVVPFMAMSSHDRFMIETPLRPGNKQRPRNITFFFAGGVCGSGRYNAVPPHCTYYKQQRYSGGVRQRVYELYSNRTGWRVVTRTDDYARDYASSRFCLAAPGGGWGKRGIVSAMYGCIPVMATDFLHEAFEPEMDWSRFGVRVPQRDIPRLGQLLESFTDQQVADMQRRTSCAAQHLHWSSSLGGIMKETGEFDAFATIMAILRMRTRHPGVDPSTYYQVDPEFRDFVDCKPGPTSGPPPGPLCTMFIGTGQAEQYGWDDVCPDATYFMRCKIGPPGGAVCAHAKNMASCTRFN
ncbi:acetylglucosaminyltransferase [Haematococcus lacustris]